MHQCRQSQAAIFACTACKLRTELWWLLKPEDLTEQKPWKLLSPTPHTMVRVMGTSRHLLRQLRSDKVVTLTSWSLAATVLLSPTSPQPAVRHLLDLGTLVFSRGINCTAFVIVALPLSCDRIHQKITQIKIFVDIALCYILFINNE